MFNASVGGPKHYGSFMGTIDYKTTVDMFSGGLTYLGIKRASFTLNGDFISSKAEFDPINMPSPPQDALDNLEYFDFNYGTVNTFSDLSYKRFDLSISGDYKVGKETTLTAEIIYIDFIDDNGYVYGDQTGSLYVLRTGLTFGLR